ncbi:MAG: ABC transporter permease subunit [Anaerolineae bacterium]|nr:ABC transporter permease subunit [Anaerolineae bacterium]
MQKIITVTRKEWAEVFKNRFVLFTVAFMPLLFTILPLILVSQGEAMGGTGDIPPEIVEMCADLGGEECIQSFLVQQFVVFYMIIPIMIPVTIASYSIVGEKTTRTLEPVLATPITTVELLAGKALAGVLPALAATWGSYALFYIGLTLLLGNPAVTAVLTQPLWLLAIFVLGPLLSVLGVSLAVMISSRVNDPRIAEQLSAMVVVPLVFLFIAQVSGFVTLSMTTMAYGALALAVIDLGLLYFASQIFQRETILTRWK